MPPTSQARVELLVPASNRGDGDSGIEVRNTCRLASKRLNSGARVEDEIVEESPRSSNMISPNSIDGLPPMN